MSEELDYFATKIDDYYRSIARVYQQGADQAAHDHDFRPKRLPRLPQRKGAGRRSARQTSRRRGFNQTAQVYLRTARAHNGGDWA